MKTDVIKSQNGVSGNALERAESVTNFPLLRKIRPMLNPEQELALQGLLVHLKGLLAAAGNEPRLKVRCKVNKADDRDPFQLQNTGRCCRLCRTSSTLYHISESPWWKKSNLRAIQLHYWIRLKRIFTIFAIAYSWLFIVNVLNVCADESAGCFTTTSLSCPCQIPYSGNRERSSICSHCWNQKWSNGQGRIIRRESDIVLCL